MTILANRTDVVNYALASHEVKADDLHEGDILDIAGGARIVRVQPVVTNWPRLSGVVVYATLTNGDRRVRSYDDSDVVSVLVA